MPHRVPAFSTVPELTTLPVSRGRSDMDIQTALQQIPPEAHGTVSAVIGGGITAWMTRKIGETWVNVARVFLCGAALGILVSPAVCLACGTKSWEYIVAIGVGCGLSGIFIIRAMHKVLDSDILANAMTGWLQQIVGKGTTTLSGTSTTATQTVATRTVTTSIVEPSHEQ